MIFTERTIKVSNGTATIDAPVILYRGDRKIEIKFTIVDAKFKFSEGSNMINSMNASYAQLAIINPNGSNAFTEIAKTEDGVVVLEITAEMIDQLEEVGFFSFHIRLYDKTQESRISLPPIERGIEVREPITSEDDVNNGDEVEVVNTVGDATVGDSVAEASEEPVGDTFDTDGNYNKTTWATGDKITEGKLNKVEDALDTLNQNDKSLEKKFDSLFDTSVELKDLSEEYDIVNAYYYANGNVYEDERALGMFDIPLNKYDELYITATALYSVAIMVIYNSAGLVLGAKGTKEDGDMTWVDRRIVVSELLAEYPTAHHVSISSFTNEASLTKLIVQGQTKGESNLIASIKNTSPLNGKKWVVIGDSLTEANRRTTKNYHDYVAEETGVTVVNMGLSGSGYKKKYDTEQAFYQRVLNVPLDADIITIFGSGNDLSFTLGEVTDTGTDTLCGCMHQTIQNLFSVMPGARLGIVLPTPWIGQQPSNKNCTMAKYCEALKEIAGYYSIPVLDLYHGSNLRPWDETFRSLYYKKDDGNGVHPDEDGHALIANKFKMFIQSL